jgi:tetratricopeptide (TPR) repeat protein
MEKGKLTQSTNDFNQSLQYFNQALAVSRSLPEALFNRAKLYQQISQPEKAEEDWREYLKPDSTSKRAEEARTQLKGSEENQR